MVMMMIIMIIITKIIIIKNLWNCFLCFLPLRGCILPGSQWWIMIAAKSLLLSHQEAEWLVEGVMLCQFRAWLVLKRTGSFYFLFLWTLALGQASRSTIPSYPGTARLWGSPSSLPGEAMWREYPGGSIPSRLKCQTCEWRSHLGHPCSQVWAFR